MKDKVLLVDDDAMVLAGLKRQLRNQFQIDRTGFAHRFVAALHVGARW